MSQDGHILLIHWLQSLSPVMEGWVGTKQLIVGEPRLPGDEQKWEHRVCWSMSHKCLSIRQGRGLHGTRLWTGVGGGLRTSSLPGELLKAVDAEAVAALSLDRLPQHLETLLTFVFILHGHRQHAEGNSWQRRGAVQWNSSHSPPSICCEFLWRYNEC